MKNKFIKISILSLLTLHTNAAITVSDEVKEADLPPELVAELKKQDMWTASVVSAGNGKIDEKIRQYITSKMSYTQFNMQEQKQSILSMVEADQRIYDPFKNPYKGLLPKTDLGEKVNDNVNSNKPVKITLQDASRTLLIRGIKPEHKEFMVEGARNLFEGDKITLRYKGQEFRVRIETVEYDKIIIRDRKNGDKAIIPIDLVPKTMGMDAKPNSLNNILTPMEPVNPIQRK